jgi:ketosteroid isomerase-like protein
MIMATRSAWIAGIAVMLITVWASSNGRAAADPDTGKQEIEENGEWASEWAMEHQIVEAPPGKENFEGDGRMLVVLHKEADGNWRITREMWNQGVKP